MKSLTLCVALALTVLAGARAGNGRDSLYNQLGGADAKASTKAYEKIVAESEATPAIVLFRAAGVALKEKKLEDAGFLFYTAKLRVTYDRALFPPTGTGSNSPLVLVGALNQQFGSMINPALMREPAVLAKVIQRIKSWDPETDSGYVPGWEFKEKGEKKAAERAFDEAKQKFLSEMGGLATLLGDARYFAAFKTGQSYNLSRGPGRPAKEDYDAAVQTMASIEAEKGIAGFAAQVKQATKR